MDNVTIPRAPKLPSDLADLVAFDGSDRAAFNAFARAVSRADFCAAGTVPALPETVRPGRR